MKKVPAIAVLALASCLLPIPSASAGERTLHTFVPSTSGIGWGGLISNATLVADPAGNLYGTTVYGGKYNDGVVFELSRTGKGYWTERVLHNFGDSDGDGVNAWGGLTIDSAGNLYGTTHNGGSIGLGAVFELSPGRNGNWRETIIYSFGSNDPDGEYPFAGLVMDGKGNLYGTTEEGGTYTGGVVYELSPAAGGGWTESVLHSFGASQNDGINPHSPFLSLDAAGNLYGVTYQAGAYNSGTVFQLSPGSSGQWTETIVYAFTGGTDGSYPDSSIALDSKGNLYGATQVSLNARGTVFEISPLSGGGWQEQTIYTFTGLLGGEVSGLTMVWDSAGNLYGTSPVGGANNYGDVWELSPSSSGTWSPTIVYSFDQTNGAGPVSGVIRDSVGNLYGTTPQGGDVAASECNYQGCGVVFEITP